MPVSKDIQAAQAILATAKHLVPTLPSRHDTTEALILFHLLEGHAIRGDEARGCFTVNSRSSTETRPEPFVQFLKDPVSGGWIESNTLKAWVYYLKHHYGWEIATHRRLVRTAEGRAFKVDEHYLFFTAKPFPPGVEAFIESVRRINSKRMITKRRSMAWSK